MNRTFIHFDVHLSFDRDLPLRTIAVIKDLMQQYVAAVAEYSQGHFDDLDMQATFEVDGRVVNPD